MSEKEIKQENSGKELPQVEETLPVTEEKVELGKFKDVNALAKAYESLQSEFTKRCQRIKELEQRVSEFDKTNIPNDVNAEASANAGISEEEKEEILKGYLKQVVGARSRAILLDGEGTGLKTPSKKPKTVAEAGILAKEILSK